MVNSEDNIEKQEDKEIPPIGIDIEFLEGIQAEDKKTGCKILLMCVKGLYWTKNINKGKKKSWSSIFDS